MTLAFLNPVTDGSEALAESPFAGATADAGAAFEARDGWRIATGFGQPGAEALACEQTVGWADVSHLGKLEIQVAETSASELGALAGGLQLGSAVRHHDAWWCLITPVRALVICEPGSTPSAREELETLPALSVIDVTTQFGALRLGGPEVRETLARFCALDLRTDRAPVGAFLPGSVARVPGFVLREAQDRYLALVGSAYALYVWTVVADAGQRLGGRPVGTDVLPAPASLKEADAGA